MYYVEGPLGGRRPQGRSTDRGTAPLRARLLRWYARRGRALPWRRTHDPYAILVSEVMLQQTQAARVGPAYRRFLRRFPTLRALAQAPLGEVLREWSGLGYNRRARDLHRSARARPDGLPERVADLDALPGVGAYTAAAVACFAFGAAVPLAETNIRRVLGRALLGRVATEKEALALDAAALSHRSPARWHHALMDLGATVCLSRTPRCVACPFKAVCAARRAGTVTPPPPRRQPAFATSDRRIRGRIVAALRSAPRGIGASVLARAIGDERVGRLVETLAAEGLVERAGARLRLPAT